MAVDTNIHVKVEGTQTQTAGLGTARITALLEKSFSWASGTGANQADRMYQVAGATIGSSATVIINLSTATDMVGTALAMKRMKCFCLYAYPANANDLNIVRPATNGVPWFNAVSDGLLVRPGGIELWGAPDAVGVAITTSTADIIHLINPAATTITYDLIILGASV